MNKVQIGPIEFSIKFLYTDTQRRQGVKGMSKLKRNEGVALLYHAPTLVTITMKDVKYDLGIIFVRDDIVVGVALGTSDGSDIEFNKPVDVVYEVLPNKAMMISIGDEVKLFGKKTKSGKILPANPNIVIKENTAAVLDEDGNVQHILRGRETVFSRKDTDKLIELAELAETTGDDDDYKKLGKAVMRMLNKQQANTPEYAKN
jgi:uncharacterized membrane protein (UPF0127 family)